MKKKQKVNGGFGTTALVMGILALCVFPPIFGVLAIVFGVLGENRNQKYAIAGVIMGCISLVFMFLIIYIMMVLAHTL